MSFIKTMISIRDAFKDAKDDFENSLNKLENDIKRWSIEEQEKSKLKVRAMHLETIEKIKKESKIITAQDIRLLLEKKYLLKSLNEELLGGLIFLMIK